LGPVDPAQLAWLLAGLAGAGVFAGLVAGLFGVGGGTVIVPALFWAFALFGFDGPASLHVAIGTSLATIITTSLRSVAAHRAHGAVDEAVLRGFLPWIGVGALVGAIAASFADKGQLGLVYGVMAVALAAYMALGREDWRVLGEVPTGAARAGTGTALGAVSALMGIGGGAFGSAVMTLAGRPIHQAVATASGFGVAIAIPATAGFVLAGLGAEGRPPLSFGYVNVPGFVILGLLTGAVAPLGARLAHRLPRTVLRRAFGLYLAVTALLVLVRAIGG
jgi:uncharacterized protein